MSHHSSAATVDRTGHQRLSLQRLQQWETLRYGMFIHFGMSTYDGTECSLGKAPSSLYCPTELDVDQWVSVARDAGMRYAVLTTKHVSGHCLWPTAHTDYSVATSGNRTDVVEAFVRACEKRGLLPGLYYCSWDNHHTLGSVTPSMTQFDQAYTTQAYREFQLLQIDELLSRYKQLVEFWVDVPTVLGYEGRKVQYQQIADALPDTPIMGNNGFGDGTKLHMGYCWPTDLMTIERWLPSSDRGYNPWHQIAYAARVVESADSTRHAIEALPAGEYYIPGEVCDPIGYEWFHYDRDVLRSDEELLGMRLICHARRVNFLLDVPPDRRGLIPTESVKALMRLHRNFESFSKS